MQLLAGDVGGTKTLLCVAERDGAALRILRKQRFENANHNNFTDLLRTFLSAAPPTTFAGACVAIAGPVRARADGQYVKVTNLPWEIDSATLAQEFRLSRVRLLNDFAAIGYAIEEVRDADLVTLNTGVPAPHGPRVVIGAGTGLGQAILFWNSNHYEVIATEGSKADFGPTDELQLELARALMQRHGRASYELILSGAGLVRLYEFLRDRAGARAPIRPEDDLAAAITQAALDGGDALASAALDLFVSIYGAQAGNLALTAGATGGVYIAGGIAPKIISRLTDGAFMKSFINKGKMKDYVGAMPVRVVMNPETGLCGALSVAARIAADAGSA
jgi:glucokinase